MGLLTLKKVEYKFYIFDSSRRFTSTTPGNKKFCILYFLVFCGFFGFFCCFFFLQTQYGNLGNSSSLSWQWHAHWFTQVILLLSGFHNDILRRKIKVFYKYIIICIFYIYKVPAFPASVEKLRVQILTYSGRINCKDFLGQVLRFCRDVRTMLRIRSAQPHCIPGIETGLCLCPSHCLQEPSSSLSFVLSAIPIH